VFSVDSKGYASIWVYSQAPLIQYQQFGITIEPTGGSLGPTGAKVLGGKL
jgi:anti-sigma-K factor RskA